MTNGCPVCERRAVEERKAASKCEQEVKELETKSARLTIVLTVLATLVGKELLDEAIGIADSISLIGSTAPSIKDVAIDSQYETADNRSKKNEDQERVSSNHTRSVDQSSSLFAYVPPLLVNLHTEPPVDIPFLLFEDQVPVPGVASPLYLTTIIRSRRR